MLQAGDRAPLDVRVWTTPQESATLGELVEHAHETILLVFYLFDWSTT
ncbi:MAG: hypothetical protein JOZ56_07275 [Actinobacteria bacterium]|nr:hypothetical protein [Actinomycetota bacterium]